MALERNKTKLSIDLESSTPSVGMSTPGMGSPGGMTPNRTLSPVNNGSPISSHRRSSSISSSVNLNLPSNYTGSLSTSYSLPMGINKIAGQNDTLGVNSIAELVDGNTGIQRPSGDGTPTRRPGGGGHHIAHPFKAPTSKDIPPVTLSPIKKVQKSQLTSYWNSIAEDYDSFYASKLSRGESNNDDTVSSFTTVSEDATISPTDTRSQVPTPIQPDITPLSSIPDVFFESKFQLDNPRTFDMVSENSDIVRQEDRESGRKVLANNTILQEKLSFYIDTVELHLINEISNSSTSFFSALGDLKNIRKQAASCVDRIERLRGDLKVVDQKRALAGVENLKLKQRRKNVAILSQSLLQISTVLEKSRHAWSLLDDDKEITQCLDTIDATEALISGDVANPMVQEWCKGWTYPIIDLKAVNGLSDERENLCTLRNRVGESYSTAFKKVLLDDLEDHLKSVPRKDTLGRLGKLLDKYSKRGGDNTKYLDVSPEFRSALEGSLKGLVRSDNIMSAFRSYKDAVVKKAKDIVREFLPSKDNETVSMSSSSTNRSVADKSRALTTLLYEMSPEEAEVMVCGIYTTLSELFRRLLTQQKILLDITSSVSSSMPPIDLNDLLNNVVETSQKRMVKVLNARRNQTARLGLQEFFNFYSLNAMFLSECESICGEPGVDLRACVSGQIKTFLNIFHRDRCGELKNAMEKDHWKEIEITKEFQSLVDTIVSCGSKDPEEWSGILRVILTKPTITESDTNDDNNENGNDTNNDKTNDDNRETNDANDKPSSTKKLPRNVFVENNSFIIANAARNTIEACEGYLKLCVVLPHLSSDIIKNLNELIQLFNTTSNDLILGTGAVRSAGLKHITAKHLALCHESLNFMIHLLPHITDLSKRHCSISTDVSKLDTTKQELTNHMEEIQSKMISLMSDRITGHCNSIKRLDWNKEQPSPCNKYMQDLVKEVSLLIKIVNNYLPKQIYLVSYPPSHP
ncbi:hypothetical protein TRICI_002161 [Trichomonascus ciferrii]|uniref:Vacuolar protein sorting-associated protein 54 C-terminal domain-containing protein n=1 Tax=Trichomonascus ciferrii TaxID=44093 RepID=A0A642VC72_9ASCO|nr:hypothetical protein TRICI_002161 [Trichomonascus ciferrii]